MNMRPSKRTATVLVLVVTLLLAGCTGPGGGATTPDNATGAGDAPVDAGTADQTPAPEGGGDAGEDAPAGTADAGVADDGTA